MTRNENTFRFLEWEVYKTSQSFFGKIVVLFEKLPNEIKFSLGNQILRSSLSIVLNIAEGSGRGTDKELNRFFDISIGSINETLAALDALRLNSYINQKEFEELFENLKSISKQLGGFKRKIRNQS